MRAAPTTMRDLVYLSRDEGNNFFSLINMRAFHSKTESELLGQYFITSEVDVAACTRRFSIRSYQLCPFVIDTVGDYLQYGTIEEALAGIPKAEP